VLTGNLVRHLGSARLPGSVASSGLTPALLDKLAPPIRHGVAAAYAQSIQTVFTIAVPIAAVAFLAAWLIPQVALRKGVGAARTAPAEEPAPPITVAS
jgi:hypothetical protein